MEHWILDHKKRHHRFFEEMTRIPHGSYHEQAYGDYLVQFARERHFEYRRDEIGNVVIYKPASEGYEDHPYVALQSHMDMVWNKEEGNPHDFLTEPLKLYIEDGFLKARGTTLGADDGTGVAYTLAVLDDDSLKTPPIEAIFTVQEETGLGGALALKKEDIRSRRMISLDCGGGDSIYISSLAGLRGRAERKLEWEEADGRGYQITVSGLTGGYSDGYKKEQANANQAAARLAYQLGRLVTIRLTDAAGGEEENKIAASCRINFTSKEESERLREGFDFLAGEIRRELREGEPGIRIQLEPVSSPVKRQMTADCSEKILAMLFLFPCGFRHKSVRFSEIMSESANWSVVECREEVISLTYNLRGSSDSRITFMQEQVLCLAESFGFTCQVESSYPAWEFHDSELLHTLQRVFRENRGKELGLIPVQGGLECGVFARMYPEMDIIAMGPFGYDVHTPNERLDLQNFDELYEVFCKLLAEL